MDGSGGVLARRVLGVAIAVAGKPYPSEVAAALRHVHNATAALNPACEP